MKRAQNSKKDNIEVSKPAAQTLTEELNPKLIKKEILFSQTPVLKALLKISIPGLIGMLVLSLYSVVDSLVSINFGGYTNFNGSDIRQAIQTATPMYTLALAFVFLITIGTTSRFSIYLGRKNEKDITSLLGTSYTFLLITMVIVIVIATLITPTIIDHLTLNAGSGHAEQISYQGKWYAWILLWMLPVYAFSFMGSSMLRSEGYPYASSVGMIIGAVFNVGGDFALVVGAHMSLIGSAIATVLSWVVQFAFVFYYLLKNRKHVYFFRGFSALNLKWMIMLIIVIVGFSSFLRNLGMGINSLVLNFLISNLPNNPHNLLLATYGTIGQIIMVFMLPIFGIVQASSSFIGYNVGKRNAERVRKAVKLVFLIFTGYLMIAEGLIMALHYQLLYIFRGNENVFDPNHAIYFSDGWQILWRTFFLFFLLGPQFTGMVFFQSMNLQKMGIFVTSLRFIIVYIPVVLIFYFISKSQNNHEIFWFYYPVTDVVSSCIALPILLHWYNKIKDGNHFPDHKNELDFSKFINFKNNFRKKLFKKTVN